MADHQVLRLLEECGVSVPNGRFLRWELKNVSLKFKSTCSCYDLDQERVGLSENSAWAVNAWPTARYRSFRDIIDTQHTHDATRRAMPSPCVVVVVAYITSNSVLS